MNMDHHDPLTPGNIEPSPELTLAQIGDGARQLVAVAYNRLDDIRKALDEGRFDMAFDRTQELLGKIQPLSQAENYIGVFASTFVLRADQIEEGMVLHHFGRVTAIERREHAQAGAAAPCIHIKLVCEDIAEPVEYSADRELVVLRETG